MGQPVAGNPSQFMMERCFAAAGLDCRYLTLEVAPDRLADAVRGMKAMGFRGGNFAAPHTEAVVPYLDRLTPSAELIGAVNCCYRDEQGIYVGDNTDGKAFCQGLQALAEIGGKNIVVLGAGTVARSIAVEAGLAGAAEITIVNQATEQSQFVVDLLNERVHVLAIFFPWNGDYEVAAGTDIVVNATDIGAGDGEVRVPLVRESLTPETIVADVVSNPPRTQLLRMASEQGCRTLDGLGILVNQAAICFRAWTGVEPDREVMREALEEYLEL
jgi:shikimate dehydrogenase